MHLQFKFTFFRKNARKKFKKYSKSYKKVPNGNMCLYTIYKAYKQKLKSKLKTKILCLVSRLTECEVVAFGKASFFAECVSLVLGKVPLCPVLGNKALGKDFFKILTAKCLFALA
jgi:hypothetical protein